MAAARADVPAMLLKYVLWVVQVQAVGVEVTWGQISASKTPTAGLMQSRV